MKEWKFPAGRLRLGLEMRIFEAGCDPKAGYWDDPMRSPGVGLPAEVTPWKHREASYMFHNHSIPRTLAPGTCCRDRFRPRHYWLWPLILRSPRFQSPSYSHPFVWGGLDERMWSWRLFSKLLTVQENSDVSWLPFIFSVLSLKKKKKKALEMREEILLLI